LSITCRDGFECVVWQKKIASQSSRTIYAVSLKFKSCTRYSIDVDTDSATIKFYFFTIASPSKRKRRKEDPNKSYSAKCWKKKLFHNCLYKE
jgi:hypothetical protein